MVLVSDRMERESRPTSTISNVGSRWRHDKTQESANSDYFGSRLGRTDTRQRRSVFQTGEGGRIGKDRQHGRAVQLRTAIRRGTDLRERLTRQPARLDRPVEGGGDGQAPVYFEHDDRLGVPTLEQPKWQKGEGRESAAGHARVSRERLGHVTHDRAVPEREWDRGKPMTARTTRAAHATTTRESRSRSARGGADKWAHDLYDDSLEESPAKGRTFGKAHMDMEE